MKTNYLVIFAFIISTSFYAQETTTDYGFDKGDIYISTTLKYRGYISNRYSPSNTLFIEPSVGYFVSNNISMGIQSEFTLNNNYNQNKSFSIGINGRYYYMPKKRLNIFNELSIDYSKDSNNYFYSRKSNTAGGIFST